MKNRRKFSIFALICIVAACIGLASCSDSTSAIFDIPEGLWGDYEGVTTLKISRHEIIYNNIVDKRKVPFKPNIKTIEQAINRVLWIYDRESTVNWMSLHENLIDGENDIQIKLSSQKGRQEICEQLLKAKGGAKPRKALKIIDELINELTTFQNEAVKSFEY